MKRFRGGLVFKAHRLLYHSTLGVRMIKKKRGTEGHPPKPHQPYSGTSLIRKHPPLGPYGRPMPRVLGWSYRGGQGGQGLGVWHRRSTRNVIHTLFIDSCFLPDADLFSAHCENRSQICRDRLCPFTEVWSSSEASSCLRPTDFGTTQL